MTSCTSFIVVLVDDVSLSQEFFKASVPLPFLLAELSLPLEPAQEHPIRSQTVAVTGRLQQLDLSHHLKLLHSENIHSIICTFKQDAIDVALFFFFTLRRFSKLMRPPCGRTQRIRLSGPPPARHTPAAGLDKQH